ncbi:MAG: glycosyltransferase [FCB group bacterium]|nr:glycosyltransferase [FCB group bacterium]
MVSLMLLPVLVYGLLLLWFTLKLETAQPSNPIRENEDRPFVSVIVAARNEEHTLPSLIDALQHQTYPETLFEIIIVNDRSTDGTALYLDEISEKIPQLKILTVTETPEGWAPKKWALNSAVLTASGDLILQTDADCRPCSNWISTMVSGFSDPETGFLSAPAPLTAHQTYLDALFEMESLAQDALSAGGMEAGIALSCTGRNMAFRKDVFNAVSGYSGFEHILSGDDDLLLQKVSTQGQWKLRFLSQNGAIVESDPPRTINQFIYQRLRFASKGIEYYTLSTGWGIRLILPLIFLTNLTVTASLIIFTETAKSVWLMPFIVKSFTDGLLIRTFYRRIERPWSLLTFLPLTLLHPLYVVLFGAAGPFLKPRWGKDEI